MSADPQLQPPVLRALAGVRLADGRDVVSVGLPVRAWVDGATARVAYRLPAEMDSDVVQRRLVQDTQRVLSALPGVQQVTVEFATERMAGPAPGGVANVRHVIAVGAGKGGVGKSTLAVLLAQALRDRKRSVGVLDADVYGPSLPMLTGTRDAQPLAGPGGLIVPTEHAGVRILSMGYLVSADQAVVWRGPMAQKYVREFLERGDWGQLDYLIVDLPPGTGDIPLTLAQSLPLTGAVVVCTPQDVALLDAVRAIRMYEKLGVPLLGIVENMSYYICPHCGKRDEIFSHGGAATTAVELGVPFLGELPLNVAIRRGGDQGRLLETSASDTWRAAMDAIVAALEREIARRAASQPPAPQIRIVN